VGRTAEQEFTRFVHERGDALLRVAQALAGDQHTAEDLLQNALAKAYARWPRIRGDAEPYVRQILYHDQISLWRRRSRRAEVTVAEVPERQSIADAQLDHDTAVRMLLRDALRALPPRQRAVLVLRYLEDQTVEQTAAMLGCRPGTVASQASRALVKLRELVPELAEAARSAGRDTDRQRPGRTATAEPSGETARAGGADRRVGADSATPTWRPGLVRPRKRTERAGLPRRRAELAERAEVCG
jgi:RNA polymerase sigma-70 factor (sigma-E family)